MVRHWLYKKLSAGARTSRILLYHRIADEPIDVWDLAVRPDIFESHLKWLKNNCRVLSLSQLVEDWKHKTLKKIALPLLLMTAISIIILQQFHYWKSIACLQHFLLQMNFQVYGGMNWNRIF